MTWIWAKIGDDWFSLPEALYNQVMMADEDQISTYLTDNSSTIRKLAKIRLESLTSLEEDLNL